MLLNSFLILTWFRKITVIIETDREDDSDIAHHGFPSNALKRTHSHWLNWSVQMACFVLTLLDSFSSHCFFFFFATAGRDIFFSNESICAEGVTFECIELLYESYIFQRRTSAPPQTKAFFFVTHKVLCQKDNYICKYTRGWIFSSTSPVSRQGQIRIEFLFWDGFCSKCKVDETPQPIPSCRRN